MKSGILNFLEPSVPIQACNGTAYLPHEFTSHYSSLTSLHIYHFSINTAELSETLNILIVPVLTKFAFQGPAETSKCVPITVLLCRN